MSVRVPQGELLHPAAPGPSLPWADGCPEASLDIWTLRLLASQTLGGGTVSCLRFPTHLPPWAPREDGGPRTPHLPPPRLTWGHFSSEGPQRPDTESDQDHVCGPEPLTAGHVHTAVVPALSSPHQPHRLSLLLRPGRSTAPTACSSRPCLLDGPLPKTDPGSQWPEHPWALDKNLPTSQGLHSTPSPRTPPSSGLRCSRASSLAASFPGPHLATPPPLRPCPLPLLVSPLPGQTPCLLDA